MADSIAYHQLAVQDREIRLLHIDNGNEREGILKCSLEQISLNSDTMKPYIAVSYCWGTSMDKSLIVVDGQEAKVPRSAALTLRNLIQEPGEVIWIDAICINQKDDVEKGHQVAMMREIYSQAEEVRVWLRSLSSDVAVSAIESTGRIYEQCQEVTNGFADLHTHLYGAKESAVFQYSNAHLPGDCDWVAVKALYSLPWFSRLWVVQEVVLARKAICHLGQHKVAAKTLMFAARWMVHRRYVKHVDYAEIEGIENASSMYIPTTLPLSHQLRQAIVPDYKLSVVEVYACTLRVAFEEGKNLYLLQFVAWYVDDRPILSRLYEGIRKSWYTAKRDKAVRSWPSGINQLNNNADETTSLSVPEHPLPQYWHDIWRSMNRRFFTTADGKLGMGPPSIRRGDQLCILSGDRAPFILRRKGLIWTVVGDAYCRILMKNAFVNKLVDPAQREVQSQWREVLKQR
ncbi:heterokaryon incompatibility protein-domain-containing protein [Hypoxylon crocopeplum]|nr:heterokaryon incompatibility protein-domain-containing protein [Hypoxylon crocopeplum]